MWAFAVKLFIIEFMIVFLSGKLCANTSFEVHHKQACASYQIKIDAGKPWKCGV